MLICEHLLKPHVRNEKGFKHIVWHDSTSGAMDHHSQILLPPFLTLKMRKVHVIIVSCDLTPNKIDRYYRRVNLTRASYVHLLTFSTTCFTLKEWESFMLSLSHAVWLLETKLIKVTRQHLLALFHNEQRRFTLMHDVTFGEWICKLSQADKPTQIGCNLDMDI